MMIIQDIKVRNLIRLSHHIAVNLSRIKASSHNITFVNRGRVSHLYDYSI
jgi:hypothetical protein